MQYFVVGEDGSKYGPADVATLQSWANENRINSQTQLETADGTRVAASTVLTFAAPSSPSATSSTMSPPTETYAPQNPYSQPPGQFAQYPRQGANSGDNGAKDANTAWILIVVGFLCCPIIIIPYAFAIKYGAQSAEKGNSTGNTAKIVAIILLVLQVLGIIFYAITGALFHPYAR